MSRAKSAPAPVVETDDTAEILAARRELEAEIPDALGNVVDRCKEIYGTESTPERVLSHLAVVSDLDEPRAVDAYFRELALARDFACSIFGSKSPTADMTDLVHAIVFSVESEYIEQTVGALTKIAGLCRTHFGEDDLALRVGAIYEMYFSVEDDDPEEA